MINDKQLENFVLIPASFLLQQQQQQQQQEINFQDSKEGNRLPPQQTPQFFKEAKKDEKQGEVKGEKHALLEQHNIPTATSTNNAYNNKRMTIRNILKLIDNHPDLFLNTSDKTLMIGLCVSTAAIGDTTPKIYVL